jgi:hypothetical protein
MAIEQVVVEAGSDWIPALSGIGGTVVGALLTWWGTRHAQATELAAKLEMAREERSQQRRADAYLKMLGTLQAAKVAVKRTLPAFGIAGMQAPRMTLEGVVDVDAIVVAFATDEVRRLYEKFWNDYSAFSLYASALADTNSPIDRVEARNRLEELRAATLQAIIDDHGIQQL